MTGDVNVFLLPQHFEPETLRGGIALVMDVLRATTTIISALANGATCVIPCGDIETAKNAAARFGLGEALLGGERGGVAIAGFDLDNSPLSYTAERVAGKTVVLTTTNGTVALLRSQCADRVLVAALVNRSAVARAIGGDGRTVHLVCAGTDGAVTSEDLLCAGAIATQLQTHGAVTSRDDLPLVATDLWAAESSSPERLLTALRASRGGRNLVELGYDVDIEFAARVDSIDLVAEYFPATGRIEPVR